MKKNWLRGGAALSASLIELTDIDGSKIVTLAPNGFDGTLAAGVGPLGHGLPWAEAVAAPPANETNTTEATAIAALSSRELSAPGVRLLVPRDLGPDSDPCIRISSPRARAG